jgi:GT2 family glycosyltransferase
MLFIVIPVFNRWQFTQNCLKSLAKQSNKLFKTVVVDHGSTDGTSSFIASQFPEVKVLQGDSSMWWTAAVNLGVKYALKENAAYILTLNNDTVAEPDYVAQLYHAINNGPPNALIGSASIDVASKEVTYRGENLNWFLASRSLNNESVTGEPENGLVSASYLSGRGMLVPRVVFELIGLFDEKHFPHYMADYEFTLRAAKKGFHICYAWDAKIGTYPEASGANSLKTVKSIRAYSEHLFGIRGGGNLPLFYRFAWRHCPFYALPSYMIFGTARRLIGYWLYKSA